MRKCILCSSYVKHDEKKYDDLDNLINFLPTKIIWRISQQYDDNFLRQLNLFARILPLSGRFDLDFQQVSIKLFTNLNLKIKFKLKFKLRLNYLFKPRFFFFRFFFFVLPN